MMLESGNGQLEDLDFAPSPSPNGKQSPSSSANVNGLRHASEAEDRGTVIEATPGVDSANEAMLVAVAQVLRITRQYFEIGFYEAIASTPSRPNPRASAWRRGAVATQ